MGRCRRFKCIASHGGASFSSICKQSGSQTGAEPALALLLHRCRCMMDPVVRGACGRGTASVSMGVFAHVCVFSRAVRLCPPFTNMPASDTL
jgi:hypothetical protein